MKKRWAAWAVAGGAFVWVVWYGIHRPTAPAPFTFQGVGGAERLSLSPDGRLLAEATRAGQVDVFDTASGTRKYTLAVSTRRMAFSPDGRRLLTRSLLTGSRSGGRPGMNGVVQLWDIATGIPLSRFVVPVGPPGAPSSAQPRVAAFTADLRWAALRDPKHCTIYDLTTGRLIKALADPSSRTNNVSFSPDGHLLALGSDAAPGGLQVWDTHTWLPLAADGQVGPISSVRFSPDGTRLAAVDKSGLLCWNVRPWKRFGGIAIPSAVGEEVGTVDFSSDGRHLLLTRLGASDSVTVVECETGRRTMTLPNQIVGHVSLTGNRVQTMRSLIPSQLFLFHETYSILDMDRQQEIYRVTVPAGPKPSQYPILAGDFQIHESDFSADGHVFAAVGHDDGIIHVWHLP